MENNESKLEQAKHAYDQFRAKFKTLQMATVDKNGKPNASYSPYVCLDGDYYVYVSELSEHTQNLIDTKRASVFFLEDEQDASHLFSRRRITYDCVAESVPRDGQLFDPVMDYFAHCFDEQFISMMRGLADFHLFKLTPQSGLFVNGFAQAYTLSGESMDELSHKNDKGHRSTTAESRKAMADSST